MCAMVSVPPYAWPTPFSQNDVAPNFTGFGALNASGDRCAIIFQVPKTGTLDKAEIRTGAVTNTPDNGIRLSFQDLVTTTGVPDGTQDQFRDVASGSVTASTWIVPGLMTSDGTDTGAKRSVTRGQWMALVIDFVSFVASDSFVVATLRVDNPMIGTNVYTADGSSGSYVKGVNTYYPIMALKYDDGTYAPIFNCFAVSAVNTYTFNSGSTPDERANKWSPAAPIRVRGAWVYVDVDADFDVVLYDSGSSALATKSVDKDYNRGGTTIGPLAVLFDSSISLSAGSTYRLAIKPGASSISVYGLACNASGLINCLPWGEANAVMSTRADAGAWSDSTAEQLHMGLIIDGNDDGTGGGGGGTRAYVG